MQQASPPFPEHSPMPRAPRVSIVVNNHDYGRFLGSSISSALEQRDASVEVVVVDDGSSDESRDVIAGYAGQITAVLQDNLGQKAACNAGLAACTGDVVLFLDADDVLAPSTAAAVAEIFARRPDVARVVFRLAVVD